MRRERKIKVGKGRYEYGKEDISRERKIWGGKGRYDEGKKIQNEKEKEEWDKKGNIY